MSGMLKKIEQKLGDHPNVSEDNDVNPNAGTGIGANDGHAAGKSWTENKVQAGIGSESVNDPSVNAGSTTSDDTQPAIVQSGATQGGRSV